MTQIIETKRIYKIIRNKESDDLEFQKDDEKGWICVTEMDIDLEISESITKILKKLREE